eukprot:TRINITY_DN108007_c0_g1_i1.p1 TRINITY_DN108007_c0_g1~~TRINITY_DN108007_c0_g1_i1.p1  ORF type:complete len:291 (-),score=41.31 TRINITY_DN108007_c0_g1_i1:89-961(-)
MQVVSWLIFQAMNEQTAEDMSGTAPGLLPDLEGGYETENENDDASRLHPEYQPYVPPVPQGMQFMLNAKKAGAAQPGPPIPAQCTEVPRQTLQLDELVAKGLQAQSAQELQQIHGSQPITMTRNAQSSLVQSNVPQSLESAEGMKEVQVEVACFNKRVRHEDRYKLSTRISDLKSTLPSLQPPSGRDLVLRLTMQDQQCGDDKLLADFAPATHRPPAVLTFCASWTHPGSDCAHTIPSGHGCRKKNCTRKSCKLCHHPQCWKGHVRSSSYAWCDVFSWIACCLTRQRHEA